MADFLMAVKSVSAEKKSDDDPEPLLKAVSSQPVQKPAITAATEAKKPVQGIGSIKTLRDLLDAVRAQPDTNDLFQILGKLTNEHNDFDIQAPGPLQAQIINTLVSSIVPTFWTTLRRPDQMTLVTCLRSVAGSNAVVARLRFLLDSLDKSTASDNSVSEVKDLWSLARELFVGDDLAYKICAGLSNAEPNQQKCHMAWKEFVVLIASGKLTGTIARAEDVLIAKGALLKIKSSPWLTRGAEYAAWLGRNVDALCDSGEEPASAAAQLLGRAFGLGYSTELSKSLMLTSMRRAVRASDPASQPLASLLQVLPVFDQRRLLESSLRWLSTLSEQPGSTDNNATVLAGVLEPLIAPYDSMQQTLSELLSDSALSSAFSFDVRRACIAILAKAAPDELQSLLEKVMTSFGDRLFINHAPAAQQECAAQTLLLSAGSMHRVTPMAVLMTARSSGHMQGVSNRLNISNTRARWLGMVVGTALSKLVDKEGSRMNFGTDDMQTDEVEWYLDMIYIQDSIATIQEALQSLDASGHGARKVLQAKTKTKELPVIDGKRTYGPERPPVPVQTEVEGEKITELFDGEDDEDEDLKPYAKPDSDPEDSDEDATLVNRNKARAPVYVRDLMKMLRDDKDHDRFQIAIKTAPSLIRRKTNFGGEVGDHAEELALMLCDLQDPFDTDDFDELRLQTLIAILLSDVNTLAPWLSRQAFSGDYSVAQRCLILSALGLGGRELAGFKSQDDLNPSLPTSTTSFPSKSLPNRLHAIYSPSDPSIKRLEAASQNLEHRLI
ncbi:hypothetical protein DOTSEDRAFT_75745, partial [Dothistroma septosporum NZE10]